MTGMDISAFMTPVNQVISALATNVPTVLSALLVIPAGLIAVNLILRLTRRVAK